MLLTDLNLKSVESTLLANLPPLLYRVVTVDENSLSAISTCELADLEKYPSSSRVICFASDPNLNSAELILKKYFQEIVKYKIFYDARNVYFVGKSSFLENSKCQELLARLCSMRFIDQGWLLVGNKESLSQDKNVQGVLYNTKRLSKWHTKTIITEEVAGAFSSKELINPADSKSINTKLTWQGCKDKWYSGNSLYADLLLNKNHANSIVDFFEPCKAWLKFLKENANSSLKIPGHFLDCLWSNTFIENSNVYLIDQEWSWEEELALNVLIIRAVYYFLNDAHQDNRLPNFLKKLAWQKLVVEIVEILGINLTQQDFTDFLDLECSIRNLVQGLDVNSTRRNLKLQLSFSWLYFFLRNIKAQLSS